jgi:hypothetical protein
MADGSVGVKQSATPDRLIDNIVVTNGNGDTVYRQRVSLAETDQILAALETTTITVANPTTNPETGLAKDTTLAAQSAKIPNQAGTWAYYAGTSGTVNVTAGQRVLGIAAHATTAGSMTINGGASVPIPAGTGIQFSPVGNLVAPTLVLTGTDSYVIEVVSG